MKTVKPARNQLFCKPDEAVSVTKSGFYLDKQAAEDPKTAQVINIGNSVKDFRPKDTILYKPYAIYDIAVDGQKYFVISEDDVLGTVVEAED